MAPHQANGKVVDVKVFGPSAAKTPERRFKDIGASVRSSTTERRKVWRTAEILRSPRFRWRTHHSLHKKVWRNVAVHIDVLKRTRLLNGDYRNLNAVEHYCSGEGCCVDAKDTEKQLCDLMDSEERPDTWAANRWRGVEDSLDFHAYLLSTHGLYAAGVAIGWFGMSFA